MPVDADIIILSGATPEAMLAALATFTASRPGQVIPAVRRGEPTRHLRFLRLRDALGDPQAPIAAVPTLQRPAYWVAFSGSRCAVLPA